MVTPFRASEIRERCVARGCAAYASTRCARCGRALCESHEPRPERSRCDSCEAHHDRTVEHLGWQRRVNGWPVAVLFLASMLAALPLFGLLVRAAETGDGEVGSLQYLVGFSAAALMVLGCLAYRWVTRAWFMRQRSRAADKPLRHDDTLLSPEGRARGSAA